MQFDGIIDTQFCSYNSKNYFPYRLIRIPVYQVTAFDEVFVSFHKLPEGVAFFDTVVLDTDQITGIRESVPDQITGIKESVPDQITGIRESVPDQITGIRESFLDQITGIRESVPDGSVPDQITGIGESVPDEYFLHARLGL